jgi:hypothetical protein
MARELATVAISFKLQEHDIMKPDKARASIPHGALIP